MGYKTYQYPIFQKTVYFIFFIISLLATALGLFLPILALAGAIKGEANPAAIPAFILLGSMFILGGISLNMFMPDIRVRDDGIQIKTIFYESQWLEWQKIIAVNKHFLSTRGYEWRGIRVENIHAIYSLIGMFKQIGGKGFLITEKIQGYDDLMQVLKTKRPDLFQH